MNPCRPARGPRATFASPRWAPGFFSRLESHPRQTALAWVIVYLLLSVGWIVGTDRLVTVWSDSPSQLEALQLAKGLLFVLGTAALGYLMLSRPLVLLSRSEQRWRHVMRALDDVTWIASPDGRHMLFINDAAGLVYGRAPADFLTDPELWLKTVHPDDRAALEASSAVLLTGASRVLEYRVVRPDGSLRWLRDRASMIRDTEGEPIALAGVASDITEQRAIQDAVNTARLRLDGIVESAMDAIITVDSQQKVQVFNRAAVALFGVPVAQALGQPLERFIPARHRSTHRADVDHFSRTGSTSRRMGRLSRLMGRRADGSEVPLEATISRVGHGQQVLMTAILRDISESQRAERAERDRLQAEAANRAKSEFLSSMSHELRTPLNAVLGFSQLLLDNPIEPLSDAQAGRVAHIRQAGWHLLALINDVLDLTRVETGRFAVEAIGLPLQAAIDEACAMCQGQADQKQVAVQSAPWIGAELRARADPLRLRQVLVNLLSNAIKYNHAGGRVELCLGLSDSGPFVRIRDTGMGMTPEQLQHLFEPFNRLGRERSGIDGTGIGLVLTRQLVNLMAGELSVVSQPGQGTTVTVCLPPDSSGAGATGSPAGAHVQDPAASAPVDPGPRGLVLYVEDNPVSAILIEEALSRWPQVRFVHAEDGRSGLDLAQATRPDLVLLDMHLPEMGGLAVLRALRQNPVLQHIPVVMLSAASTLDDKAEAMAAGARDYWTKPIDLDRFEAGIAGLLGAPVDEGGSSPASGPTESPPGNRT